MKIHYSLYGEWGGEKVPCGKYTSEVMCTCVKNNVTCKICKQIISIPKK